MTAQLSDHPAIQIENAPDDNRYTVNDNWGDTSAAISEYMRGFTGSGVEFDPDVQTYLERVQPSALLDDILACGLTFPYRAIELVRWLDEEV